MAKSGHNTKNVPTNAIDERNMILKQKQFSMLYKVRKLKILLEQHQLDYSDTAPPSLKSFK